LGKRGEIEGEEGDVLLGEFGVDFLRRGIGVTASGDDYQILGMFSGDVEGCVVL